MALRCPRCETRAGANSESIFEVGTNVRATGHTHDKVLIGRVRLAAALECLDCGFHWSTIHPDAIDLAARVRSGEITYDAHKEPVDVEFE